MKDIKEIGEVIRVTENDEENCIQVHHEIEIDGKKYEILPIQCGDFAEITPDLNFNEFISKAKMDLCKQLDEQIEIYTNEDLETRRFWVKASLVIIAKKKEISDGRK